MPAVLGQIETAISAMPGRIHQISSVSSMGGSVPVRAAGLPLGQGAATSMVAWRSAAYGEPVTTLAERIEARLNLALIHQERAELEVPDARRGLATGGPGRLVIRLSLADVARIAAAVAEDV
jgi:hypothetical protein